MTQTEWLAVGLQSPRCIKESGQERTDLREEMVRAIDVQPIRKEVQTMGQTIAEALREEGERRGELKGERKGTLRAKQQTLLSQMQRKFGQNVTAAIVAAVKRTSDLPTLDEWLGNFVDADTVEDIGIKIRK